MTLYQDLGIERDATRDDVIAGYRRAARRAHPDGGGSAEKFAKISRAKAILLDPRRRAAYDKTGCVDEPDPDNGEAKAMAVVLQHLFGTIEDICGQGGNPETLDLVDITKDKVRLLVENEKQSAAKVGKAEKRFDKLAKRFRAKEGKPNRIVESLKHRAGELHGLKLQHEENIEVFKRALEILNDHVFDFDVNFEWKPGPRQMFMRSW